MKLECEGCGWTVTPGPDHPFPFQCGGARPGDDVDHLLVPLDAGQLRKDALSATNPFVRFRTTTLAYAVAREHGLDDAEYCRLVETLDARVAEVDGAGFAVTPYGPRPALAEAVGLTDPEGLWVKDETAHVAGSHKARHLMGVALYLEVCRRLEWFDARPRLAIASCGNAALAAAVVARAAGYDLDVFIPVAASPAVVERLTTLGATIHRCPRRPEEAGDPCYLRFLEAVTAGAVPFCCQGPACGLTLDGGRTLGFELALGMPKSGGLTDVIIQVGGGAFASAVIRAYEDLVAWGVVDRLPRFHTVQTEGAAPLRRAWKRMADDVAETGSLEEGARRGYGERSRYMWAWEDEPSSVASGILDDETYDWHRLVVGMLRTAGHSVVVSEARLVAAQTWVREHMGLDASATGTAGLVGLAHLLDQGVVERSARVGLIVSGIER